jgi:hypothetical protein
LLAGLLHRSDRQDKKAIQIGLHLARGLEPGKSTITASKDDPKMKQAVVTALRKISKEERRKMASENLSYSSSFDFEGGGSGGGGGGGGGYHQTPRVFGKGYSKASFFEKNRIQREGEISPRSGGGGGEFGGVGGGIEQQRRQRRRGAAATASAAVATALLDKPGPGRGRGCPPQGHLPFQPTKAWPAAKHGPHSLPQHREPSRGGGGGGGRNDTLRSHDGGRFGGDGATS